jgi:hypothetical protein
MSSIPRYSWIAFALAAACGGASPGPQGGFSSGSVSAPTAPDPGVASGTGNAGNSTGSTGATSGTSNGGTGTPADYSYAGASGSTSGTPSGSSGSAAPINGSSVPPPRITPDAFTGAPAFTSMVGNSAHKPGESCMQSGCHGPAAGAQETSFLIGGTVYKDYKGTIPAPGVEVRVLDMAGHAVSVYSGMNGNFYIHLANSTVMLPAVVGVRDGTTTRPMVTTLTPTTGMGSCAAAGCHVIGGSPATGAYYPIHVP